MASTYYRIARRLGLILLILLTFCIECDLALGATATAAFDRNSAMVGEPVGFSITFEGGQPQSISQFPRLDGLQIQSRGSGYKTTIINNVSSSQFILNYQIIPAREGTFVIPSIQASVNGAIVATQPVTLTVTKNDQAAALNNFAFVKLNVPRKEVYLGETIPIEIQLYIVQGEVPEMPELKNDGFVISKTGKTSQARTQLNGQVYHVVTVPMSVSAAKAGKLQLGPASWNVVLQLSPSRRRESSPFEDLFGPRYESRQATLLSETNILTVLPIPRTNAPASFNGTVGRFNFTMEAGPTNLVAGDPITLRFHFAGKGTLDSLSLPQLDWPEFKLYPPTSSITNTDALGLEGTKTFEQIIVPQSSTVKEIPAFAFSYFDPDKKRFETISHSAIGLTVQPSPNQKQPTVAVKPDDASTNVPPEPTDIVHIKANLGTLITSTRPLVFRPWFLAIQLVPIAAWVLLLLNRKRAEKLANNPKKQRHLRVASLVKNSLSQLESQAAENKAEEFFATTFRILQEQLGDCLDVPASSITEALLDEPVVTKRLPAELQAQLRQIFGLCNQVRYARNSKPGALAQLIPEIRSAVTQLQQLS